MTNVIRSIEDSLHDTHTIHSYCCPQLLIFQLLTEVASSKLVLVLASYN